MMFKRLGRVVLERIWITIRMHSWAHGVDEGYISMVWDSLRKANF
jgi:hypothetical protein